LRCQNVAIAKAQDFVALSPKPRVARNVATIFGVLRAIRLDDEFVRETKEVDDIRTNRRLAAKLERLHTPIA
jgi:hypothetical protein